ncbi:hypothetical protein [Nocardia sp. NPDC052566]|uniref:hypothetical protein n=1 Tax=Nocardia sp. NPDC052566 TaxID=3364330 RepID=UPI0037CB7CDB
MADESAAQVFGPMIEKAKTGGVSLKVDPAVFLTLDKAMDRRMSELRQIQAIVNTIGESQSWGLGESAPPLTSAQTIVQRFRQKASNGANNAFDTLEGHYKAAEQLQTLFRTIRERFEQTDQAFAARFHELKLAQRPEHGGGR